MIAAAPLPLRCTRPRPGRADQRLDMDAAEIVRLADYEDWYWWHRARRSIIHQLLRHAVRNAPGSALIIGYVEHKLPYATGCIGAAPSCVHRTNNTSGSAIGAW